MEAHGGWTREAKKDYDYATRGLEYFRTVLWAAAQQYSMWAAHRLAGAALSLLPVALVMPGRHSRVCEKRGICVKTKDWEIFGSRQIYFIRLLPI